MRSKKIVLVLAVVILATVFSVAVPMNISADVSGSFAGGSGTESDPYQISNLNELQNMNLDLYAHYVLINDIDASDTVNWNDGAGFTPIGPGEISPFRGSFNGNGYKITGLFINRPSASYIGLFGYSLRGELENAVLENVDLTGKWYVGGLIGHSRGGSVSNANAAGIVRGYAAVGGLVGRNSLHYVGGPYYATVSDSYAACSVSGTYTTHTSAGGLVGLDYHGRISDSHATGQVSGINEVGGLIGLSFGCQVQNSHASGSVSGSSEVGGLVGRAYGTSSISNCYATGNVAGNDYGVGGLVGFLNQFGSTISDSYATGRVSGYESVGGLVGFSLQSGPISNSYATGRVSGYYYVGGLVGRYSYGGPITNSYSTGRVIGYYFSSGGLIGRNSGGGQVFNSYWDIQTSRRTTSAGGIGKTTAQMKTQSTYDAWDFRDTWRMENGVTYPHLHFEFPLWDQYPVADAGVDQTVILNEEFDFDGSGSYDPQGGTIVNYEWDFGDTNKGVGVTPKHTYDTAGTYFVLLTVTDNDGYKDSDIVKIHVNIPPNADAGSDQIVIVGETVNFNGAGSYDVDGTIVSYEWDFGDTNTGTGAFPSHQYSSQGIYTVTLTVTDDDGASDSDSVSITVITPVQALQNLKNEIEEMELPNGVTNNMKSKTNDAIHLLEMGNINGAIHKLNDLMDYIEAQRGNKISPGQADYLIGYVLWVLDNI